MAVQPESARPVLVLASTSPQRLALLRQIGHEPRVVAVDVDETPAPNETPCALVRRLAVLKAAAGAALLPDVSMTEAGASRLNSVVLAADTVIDLDGTVLGKPRDAGEAESMLCALGGREHRVHSGVCIRRASGVHAIVVTTHVCFTRIDTAMATRYRDSGEPFGKAGGYAIQGLGARFVTSIIGSYSNVVGLPLHETARLLDKAGVPADRAPMTAAFPITQAPGQ